METILAWHFTDGMKLRDGQELIVGKTYHHGGTIEICNSGLHASEKLIDALSYAPGTILSRVACSDIIDRQSDKLVCRKRKVLWPIDATEILRKAARKFAIDVLHLWSPPEIVCKFLATGQEAYAARAASIDADVDTSYAAGAAIYATYADYPADFNIHAAYATAYAAVYAVYAVEAANPAAVKGIISYQNEYLEWLVKVEEEKK